MKRHIFLWGLLVAGLHLNIAQSAPVEGLSARLPVTQVQHTAEGLLWSFRQPINDDFIAFHWLTEPQAYGLMELASKAEAFYTRWIAAGRCPSSAKHSGVIHRLFSVDGSQAEFEVICERNNIQVEMRLSAPYLTSEYQRRLEWQEIEVWGVNVILALNGQ